MAAVYEAEQLSLGKKVAVKILASELAASTIVIERFFREARAAASVKSPYIVDVYDSGRLDDGRPFIAMELLEGESLYDRMARVRIIDVDTTIKVIVHTARGLVKAHGAGIVHRDLKPENIFLTKGEDGDDVIKILDFGLAKFYAPVNPEEKAAKRLTREGAVFGTPGVHVARAGEGAGQRRSPRRPLGARLHGLRVPHRPAGLEHGPGRRDDVRVDRDRSHPRALGGARGSAARARCVVQEVPRARSRTSATSRRASSPMRSSSRGDIVRRRARASPTSTWAAARRSSRPRSPPKRRSSWGSEALESDRAARVAGRGKAPARLERRARTANGRSGSAVSDPALPLLQRASQEVPPAADRETPAPRPRASTLRVVVSAVFLGGSISAAIFVWLRFLNPQVFTPVVQSTATAAPSAVPSGTTGVSGPTVDEPKWAPIIAEAQRRFTGGDPQGALAKLAGRERDRPAGIGDREGVRRAVQVRARRRPPARARRSRSRGRALATDKKRRAPGHPRDAEGHARHVDRRPRAEGSRPRLRRRPQRHRQADRPHPRSHARGRRRPAAAAHRAEPRLRSHRPPLLGQVGPRAGRSRPLPRRRRSHRSDERPEPLRRRGSPRRLLAVDRQGPEGLLRRVAGRSRQGEGLRPLRPRALERPRHHRPRDAPHRLLRAGEVEVPAAARALSERRRRREHAARRVPAREGQGEGAPHHAPPRAARRSREERPRGEQGSEPRARASSATRSP